MAFLDSLEHRFGRFAIPGITRILVIGQAMLFVLMLLTPDNNLYQLLALHKGAVMHGQVWRLFSYVFLPVTLSPLFFFFSASVTWFIGDALEQAWGPFKLNVFLFCGMFAITLAAFLFNVPQSNLILMMSLFLAFAVVAPEFEFLLFFILPVKVKWLGLIDLALLFFLFVQGDIGTKATVVAGVANCLIFFGPQAVRYFIFRQQVQARRSRFVASIEEAQSDAVHSCKVCGRTENSDPSLDFRIARDGEEYCMEHLPSRQT